MDGYTLLVATLDVLGVSLLATLWALSPRALYRGLRGGSSPSPRTSEHGKAMARWTPPTNSLGEPFGRRPDWYEGETCSHCGGVIAPTVPPICSGCGRVPMHPEFRVLGTGCKCHYCLTPHPADNDKIGVNR